MQWWQDSSEQYNILMIIYTPLHFNMNLQAVMPVASVISLLSNRVNHPS